MRSLSEIVSWPIALESFDLAMDESLSYGNPQWPQLLPLQMIVSTLLRHRNSLTELCIQFSAGDRKTSANVGRDKFPQLKRLVIASEYLPSPNTTTTTLFQELGTLPPNLEELQIEIKGNLELVRPTEPGTWSLTQTGYELVERQKQFTRNDRANYLCLSYVNLIHRPSSSDQERFAFALQEIGLLSEMDKTGIGFIGSTEDWEFLFDGL
jgi:hypothetical protein